MSATYISGKRRANELNGEPLVDETVPSRYALTVGEIEVTVISDGVLSLPGAMLAHNVEPAVRAAWLDEMFLPPDMLDWPLNVVVLRHGDRTILVDAGLGADPNLNLPRAGQLASRLEAAGIDLGSVTDVVLTHMHMDHIGGLLANGLKSGCVRICASIWRLPRRSSGNRPISPAPRCRRGFQTLCDRRPNDSSTSTAVSCNRSRRSTRWRRAW